MRTKNLVASLGFAIIIGLSFFASVPDAYAQTAHAMEGRRITVKLGLWDNVDNLIEKGNTHKFWIILRSGKEIFGDIVMIGKGQIHVKLLNVRDGKDDGFDMIIERSEVVAVKAQIREFK